MALRIATMTRTAPRPIPFPHGRKGSQAKPQHKGCHAGVQAERCRPAPPPLAGRGRGWGARRPPCRGRRGPALTRPLFLPRARCRRRRLRDAARLLPLFGAFLLLLPVLWSPATTTVRDTAPDGIYLFVVWAGLIVVAGLLSRHLRADDAGPADADD